MTLPDLDYSHDAWVAIGTLALAVVTLLLAAATTKQARLSRRALEASVRPLLVESRSARTARSPTPYPTSTV